MMEDQGAIEGQRWRAGATFRWLVEEGRLAADFDALVTSLAERLVADGAPIWRFRLGFRTLHPLVTAVSGTWERETAVTEHFEVEHGLERRDSYVGSPMQAIANGESPYRRRLEDGLDVDAHQALHELHQRGGTDYYGQQLHFAGDGAGIMIITSDAPGGFTEPEIEQFGVLVSVLSPIVEIERLRRISGAVAEAYLGPRAGARVLGGQITRGDVDTIDAAILICDLRDWTGASERLSPRDAVTLVNRYFDIVGEAIRAQGGEILKFMGDGVLAVFTDTDEAPDAAARALSAARSAVAEAEAEDIRMGVGLHVGEVLFGNIGSAARLDFTVLGAAVNVAARVEAQCSRLGAPVLYSEAFAGRLADPGALVSEVALKGVSKPMRVFAPS